MPLFFQLVNETKGHVLGNQLTVQTFEADGSYEFPIEHVAYEVLPHDEIVLEVISGSTNYEQYKGAAVVELRDVEVKVPLLPPD